MKASPVEAKLFYSGLSLAVSMGSITASTGFHTAVAPLFGHYGTLVFAIITAVSSIASAILAQQSTPVSIPSSAAKSVTIDTSEVAPRPTDTLQAESLAARGKVEAVEALAQPLLAAAPAVVSAPGPVIDQVVESVAQGRFAKMADEHWDTNPEKRALDEQFPIKQNDATIAELHAAVNAIASPTAMAGPASKIFIKLTKS